MHISSNGAEITHLYDCRLPTVSIRITFDCKWTESTAFINCDPVMDIDVTAAMDVIAPPMLSKKCGDTAAPTDFLQPKRCGSHILTKYCRS